MLIHVQIGITCICGQTDWINTVKQTFVIAMVAMSENFQQLTVPENGGVAMVMPMLTKWLCDVDFLSRYRHTE